MSTIPKSAYIVGPNTVNGLPKLGGTGEFCPPWQDNLGKEFDTSAARVAIWFRTWDEARAFVASLDRADQ